MTHVGAHRRTAQHARGGGRSTADPTAPVRQDAPDLCVEPSHDDTKWWTLVAVCLGTFMLLLDVTIVNVALPDIQTSLHSSFSGLQWVVDAYALTLAALLLTAGSLADLYGRKLLYVIGLSRLHHRVAALRGRRRARCCCSCHAACRASAARSCSRCRWPCSPTRSGARTAASPSASGAPSPGWPSRSARCSAGCSPPGFPGGGSSS